MPNYIDPKILGSLLGGVGPMSSRDMSISEAQKALLAEANKKSGAFLWVLLVPLVLYLT